jgi:membrane protein YqaA with SNARE-associated domain
MDELAAHLTVLGVSFLAATIIPGSSEVVLVAMVLERPAELITLFLTATVGNTAGSAVNWVLGRWFQRFAGRRWFPASQGQLDKAAKWFNKYGIWSLLLAWLPIVGDALTVIAGALKVNIYAFVALVAMGKATRYLALLWGSEALRSVIAS